MAELKDAGFKVSRVHRLKARITGEVKNEINYGRERAVLGPSLRSG